MLMSGGVCLTHESEETQSNQKRVKRWAFLPVVVFVEHFEAFLQQLTLGVQ